MNIYWSIESIAIQSTLAGQAGAPQARWTPAASLVGTWDTKKRIWSAQFQWQCHTAWILEKTISLHITNPGGNWKLHIIPSDFVLHQLLSSQFPRPRLIHRSHLNHRHAHLTILALRVTLCRIITWESGDHPHIFKLKNLWSKYVVVIKACTTIVVGPCCPGKCRMTHQHCKGK